MSRIWDAWNIPGPAPDYHRDMQAKLRREWPVLADALDNLTPPDVRDMEELARKAGLEYPPLRCPRPVERGWYCTRHWHPDGPCRPKPRWWNVRGWLWLARQL